MTKIRWIFLIILLIIGMFLSIMHFQGVVYQKIVRGPFEKGFLETPDGISSSTLEDARLWDGFHFSHFYFLLPSRHPEIRPVPKIKSDMKHGKVQLGLRMLDPNDNDQVLASFLVTSPFPLNLSLDERGLFSLRFFRKYLMSIPTEKIWKDLFARDLTTFMIGSQKTLGDKINAFFTFNYKELIYNLYIHRLRSEIFSPLTLRMSYYQKSGIGITEVKGRGGRRQEILYLPRNRMIYPLIFSSSRARMVSRIIRKKFLDSIEYRPSSGAAAEELLKGYKNLSSKKKNSGPGVTYLYSAMTHRKDDKDFIKKIISFLEQGKSKMSLLYPFYQYAYKRFNLYFVGGKKDKKAKMSMPLPDRTPDGYQGEKNKLSVEEKVGDDLEKARQKGDFDPYKGSTLFDD